MNEMSNSTTPIVTTVVKYSFPFMNERGMFGM